MSFVERELRRIRQAMALEVNADNRAELRAARQALNWALEPSRFQSPYVAILDKYDEPMCPWHERLLGRAGGLPSIESTRMFGQALPEGVTRDHIVAAGWQIFLKISEFDLGMNVSRSIAESIAFDAIKAAFGARSS